jgi:hypothetical protein
MKDDDELPCCVDRFEQQAASEARIAERLWPVDPGVLHRPSMSERTQGVGVDVGV